jgi:hypothetical protein
MSFFELLPALHYLPCLNKVKKRMPFQSGLECRGIHEIKELN